MIEMAFLVAAVLGMPGPTNTPLAGAGARAGFRHALPLVPAELCGYLLAIAGWGLALEPAAAALPWLKPTLRIAAAAYLAVVAGGLWRADSVGPEAVASPRRVLLATLLNPKALVLAGAVFPQAAFRDGGTFLLAMATFAATLVPVAPGWIRLGACLSGPAPCIRPRTVQRGAALVLLGFSASLAAPLLA